MSKKTIYKKYKGEVLYPKIFESNRDMFDYNLATGAFDLPSSCNGKYQLPLYMEPDDYTDFADTGAKLAEYGKFDEEKGKWLVRFKREHEKRDRSGNLLDWASGPPKVVDKDGKPWDPTIELGNGTEVEAEVVIYFAGRVYGTRLEKVKVLNLVEFEREEEKEEEGAPF